jgi:hypothetical protein
VEAEEKKEDEKKGVRSKIRRVEMAITEDQESEIEIEGEIGNQSESDGCWGEGESDGSNSEVPLEYLRDSPLEDEFLPFDFHRPCRSCWI